MECIPALPRTCPDANLRNFAICIGRCAHDYVDPSPGYNPGLFSSVIEMYAPIQEPSAAKQTYTQLRV